MAQSTILPPGSLILVTGANGFIASHVVHALLQQGFRVRGTVRDLERSAWMVEKAFKEGAAKGDFELVTVADMAEKDAFKDAVSGVAGIVHLATIASLDPDPNKVIPQTIAGVVNLLECAAHERSVKAFVFTSSIVAAAMAAADVPFHVDATSWNEMALPLAWAPPPYDADRALVTYMASKVEAEKAFWKFVNEQKPAFVANAVLPFTTFGPLFDTQQGPSTNGFLFPILQGQTTHLSMIKASVHVDVRDVAHLHIAALLDPSVNHARLYGWGDSFNWNDVFAILKQLRPDAPVPSDMDGLGRMVGTVDTSVEKKLLKAWAHQDGFIPLLTSIRDTIDGPLPTSKGAFA